MTTEVLEHAVKSRLSPEQARNRTHLMTFIQVLQRCPKFVSTFILNGDRYAAPLEHGSYQLVIPSYFKEALADPRSLDLRYFSDHTHWDQAARDDDALNNPWQCTSPARMYEWPSWIRISTYDRVALNKWFTSSETAKERQEFLDAGIALSLDRVWRWRYASDCTPMISPVSATDEDPKIYSNTNYHHVYRIFSSTLFDPQNESSKRHVDRIQRNNEQVLQTFINGSENRFFDQCLHVLHEKVRRILELPRLFECGWYSYRPDGIVFKSTERELCELTCDIWQIYTGNDAITPVKYFTDTTTRPCYHIIAIGNTAIAEMDELTKEPANKVKSLPAHQRRTVEFDPVELSEAIFSDDIFGKCVYNDGDVI